MDGISPSLLHYSPHSSTSGTPEPTNPRKRRRPTDPHHEPPPPPPPDATMEERRAARAQRNRIAAQCSRDRRKGEYHTLRERISELERENEALRSGSVSSPSAFSAEADSAAGDSWRDQMQRENQDLRDKVAQLETTLQVVVRSLGSKNDASPPTPVPSGSVSPSSLSAAPVSLPPVEPHFYQTAPTRHLAAGGPLLSYPISLTSALDRDTSTDWLSLFLPPATHGRVSTLATVSEEEGARTGDCPLPAPASSAFQGAAAHPSARSTFGGQTMTFLPTPVSSEVDISEFGLDASAENLGSLEGLEEMSKYLTEVAHGGVDHTGWSWEGCGLEESGNDLMGAAAGVNVF